MLPWSICCVPCCFAEGTETLKIECNTASPGLGRQAEAARASAWKVASGVTQSSPPWANGTVKCKKIPARATDRMVSGPEQEEAYAQMAEAADKLTEVAHELDSVKQAVRQAGSAEDAEKLRRQAAATIADVASMLRAHGPAAAIAEASSVRLH